MTSCCRIPNSHIASGNSSCIIVPCGMFIDKCRISAVLRNIHSTAPLCHIHNTCAAAILPACQISHLAVFITAVCVVPYSSVRQAQDKLIACIVSVPGGTPCHLHIHGSCAVSCPVGAAAHEQIDIPQLSRSNSVSGVVCVISNPVRISRTQAHTHAAFGSHASVGDNISFNYSLVLTGACHISICILHCIYIDNPIVLRHKFSIGADRRPGSVHSTDRSSAYINLGRYGTDSLIGSFAVCHIPVCQHIHQSVNDNF